MQLPARNGKYLVTGKTLTDNLGVFINQNTHYLPSAALTTLLGSIGQTGCSDNVQAAVSQHFGTQISIIAFQTNHHRYLSHPLP
jgi:hypothetical protein